MRVTLSPLVDELTGKLGLTVFSKNRGGLYVKKFVKPTNPDTARQVNARALFGSLGSAWFSLSAANRELYSSWANDGYSPLNPDPRTVAYTGRQAYTALAQNAAYQQGFKTEMLYINSVQRDSIEQTFSASALAAPDSPPTSILADTLLYLSDDGVPGTRTYTWTVHWDQTVAAGNGIYVDFTLASAFQFTQTKLFLIGLGGITNGMKVYISEPLSVEGQKVSQPFRRCIAATGYGVGGTWSGTTKNTTDLSLGFLYNTGFSLPGAVGWYYVTLCAVDSTGQTKVIGGKYIEIT